MPTQPSDSVLHVTLSGDVYLKSRRTQKRLIATVRRNLAQALAGVGYDEPITRIGTHRYAVTTDRASTDAVRNAALTVFGVGSVDEVRELAFTSIDELAATVVPLVSDRIRERTFAVRVKRRGAHDWSSMDLARKAGAMLVAEGGSVDLTSPQETVDVTVLDERAFLVVDHRKGPGGLPIGTQDRVLCLISGGFDSVVAAWMLMSRGCAVDFVHFSLNCAQSDHALAVAGELWRTWGHGTEPTVHLVDFQPVKDALYEHVDSRMRQVTLKVLMAKAAGEIANAEGIPALVTGDALGQVSSQTLPHLVAVSKAVDAPILRPLVGLPKQAIIDLARTIGTAELSARAQEVCDLSEGRPVATASSLTAVDATVTAMPEHVLEDVVATAKVCKLADWSPGQL